MSELSLNSEVVNNTLHFRIVFECAFSLFIQFDLYGLSAALDKPLRKVLSITYNGEFWRPVRHWQHDDVKIIAAKWDCRNIVDHAEGIVRAVANMECEWLIW